MRENNITVSHDGKGITQRCYHDFNGIEYFYLNYYVGDKLVMNSASYCNPLNEAQLFDKLQDFLEELQKGDESSWL